MMQLLNVCLLYSENRSPAKILKILVMLMRRLWILWPFTVFMSFDFKVGVVLHAQNWIQNFTQNTWQLRSDVLISAIYVNKEDSFQSKLNTCHSVKDFIPNFIHEAFSFKF